MRCGKNAFCKNQIYLVKIPNGLGILMPSRFGKSCQTYLVNLTTTKPIWHVFLCVFLNSNVLVSAGPTHF